MRKKNTEGWTVNEKHVSIVNYECREYRNRGGNCISQFSSMFCSFFGCANGEIWKQSKLSNKFGNICSGTQYRVSGTCAGTSNFNLHGNPWCIYLLCSFVRMLLLCVNVRWHVLTDSSKFLWCVGSIPIANGYESRSSKQTFKWFVVKNEIS